MTKLNFCVRQHYIPQFLQKGFTFDKNEIQTWVIRSNKIYPAHIKDNFVQNQFYSDIPKTANEPKTLDQKITDHEHKILNILNELKTLNINQEYILNNDYYHIIWHFILRNKEFSESFWNSLMMEYFKIYQNKLYTKAFNKWFNINQNEIVFNILNSQGFNLTVKKEKEVINHLNNREIINKISNKIGLDLTSFKNVLFKNLLENNDIRKTINSFSLNEINFKEIDNWKFKILPGHFVLPDTVIISAYNDKSFPFMPYLDKESLYILFPLSKHKLMVIYPESFPNNNILDLSKVNEYLTSCSESFICDDKSFAYLQKKLSHNLFSKKIEFEVRNNNENTKFEILKSFEKSLNEELIELRNRDNWIKYKK